MADDDGDQFEGLESLDITACKERIVQLQAERERSREFTERYQEKLKALNNELAARKEEADRSRKELLEEQARNRRLAEQRREREGQAQDVYAIQDDAQRSEALELQISHIRRFMEHQLQEKVERAGTKNELGIRVFDEVELMVEKSPEEQAKESTNIDTVLVTYSVPNSELKYNLSFRVDRNMTSKKLREDACLYWGLSEVEFILKTMTNSKLHDDLTIQNCFRASEDAHLILAQKTPKNTQLMDKELKDIGPKIGFKARIRTTKKGGDEAKGSEGDRGGGGGGDLVQQMAAVPGVFEFMTQRDRNVVQHLPRMKLRCIIVYGALVVLTLQIFFSLRPFNDGFFCRQGVFHALTGNTHSVSFKDIRSQDQVWDWLDRTVVAELFEENSFLRQDNYLLGYLQVRMQEVTNASISNCPAEKDTEYTLPGNTTCYKTVYDVTSAGDQSKEDLRLYWDKRSGKDGRSLRKPWQYETIGQAAEGAAVAESTYYVFDQSGYSAEYSLMYQPLSKPKSAFQADMAFLRSKGWLSSQTRAVHVIFGLYNINYDHFVSNRYTFEMSTFGVVLPTADVGSYRPVIAEGDQGSDLMLIDIIRLVLVLYVSIYQVYWDFMYERRVTGSGKWHLVSLKGLADLAIGGLFFAVFAARFGYFSVATTTTLLHVESYEAGNEGGNDAYAYTEHLLLEPIILALCLYRLLFFLGVNRNVFIIWTALANCLSISLRFAIIFGPVLLGLVFFGMAISSSYLPQNRTFGSTYTLLVMMLFGDLQTVAIYDPNRPWTIAFGFLIYIVMRLIFINVWIAILIQVYQKTRVEAGFRPDAYKWKEYNYVSWTLIKPFRSLYLNFVRPKIERPKVASDDD
ncbi:unnamed protein product [Polarella glacialis]|uniref:Polycystin domain-containing protein n=1 Tax=Polarella glacialis TaxID=89957 RepID=A0A813ESN5_POLGL|nr:unnamed protein product [Polarella glacialis]